MVKEISISVDWELTLTYNLIYLNEKNSSWHELKIIYVVSNQKNHSWYQ